VPRSLPAAGPLPATRWGAAPGPAGRVPVRSVPGPLPGDALGILDGHPTSPPPVVTAPAGARLLSAQCAPGPAGRGAGAVGRSAGRREGGPAGSSWGEAEVSGRPGDSAAGRGRLVGGGRGSRLGAGQGATCGQRPRAAASARPGPAGTCRCGTGRRRRRRRSRLRTVTRCRQCGGAAVRIAGPAWPRRKGRPRHGVEPCDGLNRRMVWAMRWFGLCSGPYHHSFIAVMNRCQHHGFIGVKFCCFPANNGRPCRTRRPAMLSVVVVGT
jgi:hypothetical protein